MYNAFQGIEDGLVALKLCLRAWRRVLRITSVNSNAGKGSLESGLSHFFFIRRLLLWHSYNGVLALAVKWTLSSRVMKPIWSDPRGFTIFRVSGRVHLPP